MLVRQANNSHPVPCARGSVIQSLLQIRDRAPVEGVVIGSQLHPWLQGLGLGGLARAGMFIPKDGAFILYSVDVIGADVKIRVRVMLGSPASQVPEQRWCSESGVFF